MGQTLDDLSNPLPNEGRECPLGKNEPPGFNDKTEDNLTSIDPGWNSFRQLMDPQWDWLTLQ